MIITSSSNEAYKRIRSLKDKKYRKLYSEYTVEGMKSVNDAVMSKCDVRCIVVSEDYGGSIPEGVKTMTISSALFAKLCDTQTPQGIMAVIKINENGGFELDPSKAYIYCDGINDPGNLGTIIRTADAAGFGGVLLSKGTVDLYAPKTVRASMGSFFNIQKICDLDAGYLAMCAEKGFELYAGALDKDTIDYRKADMTKPSVIIVGNEANGVSDEVKRISRCVKIPILGKAESLNASVAAAILMYELVSQRSAKFLN